MIVATSSAGRATYIAILYADCVSIRWILILNAHSIFAAPDDDDLDDDTRDPRDDDGATYMGENSHYRRILWRE